MSSMLVLFYIFTLGKSWLLLLLLLVLWYYARYHVTVSLVCCCHECCYVCQQHFQSQQLCSFSCVSTSFASASRQPELGSICQTTGKDTSFNAYFEWHVFPFLFSWRWFLLPSLLKDVSSYTDFLVHGHFFPSTSVIPRRLSVFSLLLRRSFVFLSGYTEDLYPVLYTLVSKLLSFCCKHCPLLCLGVGGWVLAPARPLPGRPLWCLQDRWQGGSCPASTARPSLPWQWGWFLSLGALWCQTSLSTPLRQPPVGCAFSPDPVRQSHPHAPTPLARALLQPFYVRPILSATLIPRHLLVSLCHTTAAVLLLSSPNPFTQLPITPVYSLT